MEKRATKKRFVQSKKRKELYSSKIQMTKIKTADYTYISNINSVSLCSK
jgi:hypothetical protein